MITSLIALLVALVPFVLWLYKRRAARRADPLQQHRDRYQQIDRDLIARAGQAASAHSADDLAELERRLRARIHTELSRD